MADRGYPPPYPQPSQPTNGNAIASLIVGVASFFVCPLAGVVAIYLANRARADIAQTGQEGEGLARAGAVLGWIALAIFALMLIAAGVIITFVVLVGGSS